MLDNKTIIKVTNRNNGSTGYVIPDLNNLYREFAPSETKEITMEELRKLSYIPGGKALLQNYLVLDNREAVTELLNEVEPEYFYTEEDIKKLLLEGSLDALMDCIDYAPNGVIDLVKKLAVDLEINDLSKRKAILDMTGFNVTKAIEINKETAEEKEEKPSGIRRINEEQKQEVKTTGRRVQPQATTVLPDNKYKIIK